MKTSLPTFFLAAAIGCTALSGTAFAQSANADTGTVQQDDGALARIAASRKLRTLSQRIPASACHLVAGVERDVSADLLTTAIAQIDATLDALEFGNADLNITGAETRRKTINAIEGIRDRWTPLKTAAEAVRSGENADANLQLIIDQNAATLAAIEQLIVEVVGQYSNPTQMVDADSFLIDIAGRQAMLIQQMSKNACLMSTNHSAPETAENFLSAISVFDASLGALRNGMPSAGVRPPPTPAIADGLDQVSAEWTAMKPTLEAIAQGTAPIGEATTSTFQELNALMATTNDVLDSYSVALVSAD